MATASRQFSVRDLLWFLFGTAAFLSAWSVHNPLGGLLSAGLLGVFYWANGARDVLTLHGLYVGVGLAAACIVLASSAFGLDWPDALTYAWWSAHSWCVAASVISFLVYVLSLVTRFW